MFLSIYLSVHLSAWLHTYLTKPKPKPKPNLTLPTYPPTYIYILYTERPMRTYMQSISH